MPRCNFASVIAALGSFIAGLALSPALLAAEPWGKVERSDPRFDKLVTADAQMERLGSDMLWAEGPIWVKEGQYLLFSDVTNNRVMKYKDGEGLTEWMKPSGFTGLPGPDLGRSLGSNGLLIDKAGNIYFCEHGDRRISVLEKGSGKRTLVDSYQGKRLNSPNDGVFKSNGDLYFTDPPYGLANQLRSPAAQLDFCGIYRLSKDGKLTLLSKELPRPNGIGFSPDEKTLYIANSTGPFEWRAFDVKEDGTLANMRTFVSATGAPWAGRAVGQNGAPDGLRVDADGNVWASGPGGIRVFAPDGTLLGSLLTPETAANLCFGGPDLSTLYITASKSLARIKTTAKGQAAK